MTSISRRQVAAAGLALPLLIPEIARAQDPTPTPPGAGIGSGGAQPGTGSGTPVPQPPTSFTPMDPVLAPVTPGPKTVELEARETTVFVAKDVAYAGWSFNGTIPGPVVRVVEGDTVTVRVSNAAVMAHSLDTHAAKTPPDRNYKVLQPGESFEWQFTPPYSGAYMYHCGTPPVLMHIGAGMYGAWIVDPQGGWPPAQELVFVQSEYYLTGEGAVKTPDFAKLMQYGALDYVAFNGYANQYVEHPITVKVGEPIRIFVVNAGPNIWSSFHVVGTIFDAAYGNANPNNKQVGLQSVTIGPGDGACVELTLEEPGTYAAVNHAFGHAQHGAIALLQAA
jgi:nitrite reductase (NO-forming)